MKRRTLMQTALVASALPLLPAGFARASELTQKYSGTTPRVMLGAGGGFWEAYRQTSEQFAGLTGINFEYTFLPDAMPTPRRCST
jgi:hypothetical protein